VATLCVLVPKQPPRVDDSLQQHRSLTFASSGGSRCAFVAKGLRQTQFRIKSLGHIRAHVTKTANKNPRFTGVSERMMGLEPTTFCMASASDRSRPFAQSACFGGVGFDERTRMNPERTPNLAILATPARDKTSRKPVLGLGR
jgi:hypothetical protein